MMIILIFIIYIYDYSEIIILIIYYKLFDFMIPFIEWNGFFNKLFK